jgi:hypothetical protein
MRNDEGEFSAGILGIEHWLRRHSVPVEHVRLIIQVSNEATEAMIDRALKTDFAYTTKQGLARISDFMISRLKVHVRAKNRPGITLISDEP